MKNILITTLVLAILSSCTKYNDNFPGYDDAAKPNTSKAQYTITLSDADYNNAAFPTAVRTNKYFDAGNKLADYASKFLQSTFPGADAGAAVKITYKCLDQIIPQNVTNFNDTVYTLTTDDYKIAYRTEYNGIDGFSPEQLAETSLPDFLKTKFPNVTEGKSKIIQYDYFSEIPGHTYFEEGFENVVATSNQRMYLEGWTNRDTSANNRFWECRDDNNHFAYFNGTSNTNQENSVYLITPEIDLADAIHPLLNFKIAVEAWNNPCLKVLVSTDFNGTIEGIKTAAWNDISADCNLPNTTNAAQYTSLKAIIPADLSTYINKKIFIAFCYDAKEVKNNDGGETDPARKTTIYKIDNIAIEEKVDKPVDPLKIAASYVFNGTDWAIAPANTITVQPWFYATMGLYGYIPAASASNFIPNVLSQQLPLATNGSIITVVYKNSLITSRADQYVKTNGSWLPVLSAPVNMTEQYVKNAAGTWDFDPTVNFIFGTDRNNADYQIMCTYVLEKWPGLYSRGTYTNEEWYYGFTAYYANITFRLSGHASYSRDVTIGKDTELHGLTNDDDKMALLWNRSKEGMNVFLQLKFPDAVTTVQGADVYYNVTARVYYPDGRTSETRDFTWRYKCTKSGSTSAAPEFEFISISPEPPINN